MMDKFKGLLEKLQKAGTGEGSRGGNVIGHTRSGQPIYASSQHEGHQEFGSGEHRDAMNHHYEIWSKTQQKIAAIRQQNPNWNPPKQIHDFLKHHYVQMQMHQSRMGQAEGREQKRGQVGAAEMPKQQAEGKKFEPIRYGHVSKAAEIVPFYAATVMVNVDGTAFLLGKRKEDGLWTSPAGGAKLGEFPKQAAIREAFEEANVVIDERQMEELPMGYAHNSKPVHCFLVRLSKEQMEKISPVNDPDKEVREWKWFPIDEKMPEPIDDNRFKTFLNAKMHLAGIMMKSYYNMDDMEGMTSVNATEQAVGSSHDADFKKHLEDLMANFKPGDEPVRVLVSANHVLHLVRIDDGIYSGFVKKNEQEAYHAEVENVLNIDKMTMSDLVELMKLKGIEPVRLETPVPTPITPEQRGIAYADAMTVAADGIAAQEQEAQEKADFRRLFPEPQTLGQEFLMNMVIDKLWTDSRKIEKAKALPVGTVRQWGPYKYVKHNDGWVVIGGEHHGKVMGDFKSQPKYGDFARHHEKSSAKPNEPKESKKTEEPVSEPTEAPKSEPETSAKAPEESTKTAKPVETPYERGFNKWYGMAPEERQALMDEVGKRETPEQWHSAALRELVRREEASDAANAPKPELPKIEGLDHEVNTRTNMIKAVDLGRNNKSIQKKFMEHLDDCNKLVDAMGIQFKTPLSFKGTALAKLGKRTRGTYTNATKTIELKDMSAANKTIMHEIGHALDYALADATKGNRGRHQEMVQGNAQGGDLQKMYDELHDVVTTSDYYKQQTNRAHKKYLVTPTEVFARAFEVYAFKKAEDAKMSPEFMETFMPDVFKSKDPELEKLKKELEDSSRELISASYKQEKPPGFEDLQKKVSSLREEFNSKIEKTDSGWNYIPEEKRNEYKEKVSTLMDKILKEDKIKKALDESDLAITLQKSQPFQKGAGLPVGSVRLWGGQKFIKHGDGHWAPMPSGQQSGQQSGQPQPQAAAQEAPKPAEGQEQKAEPSAKKESTEAAPKMGPIDHLKPEKNAGGHVSIHSKDFAAALKEGPISIISAGVNPNNPEDRALTDQQVAERYKRLEQDLKDHGYKYTKVKGHYGGEEDSFIVFHADENHMNELGKKFNQDSVIHAKAGKNKLTFTTGENAGKHHKGDGHEEVPDAKDYYSVVNTSDGVQKKFSLGLDFGKMHDEEKKEQAA